ncbi:hypothetical protein LAZ67_20002296 [Cordylochernes scorpioides]|uniref:Uncharacterized protein n=1 Tax=Cordylochernes scorpioides TaxID=51811 RepID=A0ABY6LN55_9ARAC|nr:hypothetical protein LAZ67_20002296 [Cordylochernes scorpioides]
MATIPYQIVAVLQDGVLVENMHDVPYMAGDPGPEITASMARICTEIRRVVPQMPCGIQILAGANQAALAVAHATGLDFIRAEGFVFSHVADEGLMQACAGPLLRYRRAIDAEHVLVLTDIKKKHCSHSLTADISLADTALAAQFFLTDGIIITGMATGDPPQEAHVREVSESCPHLPVLLGSGVTSDNIHCYPSSHGFIVGSHFKHGGHWAGDLDPNSVESFVSALKSAAS